MVMMRGLGVQSFVNTYTSLPVKQQKRLEEKAQAYIQVLAVCRSNRITGHNYTVCGSAPQLHTICSGLFARKVFSPTNC